LGNETGQGKAVEIVRSGGAKNVGHAHLPPGRGSDQARLLQRLVGAVLVDGLETTGAHPNAHVFAELGHPDALLTQVGLELATHRFGDVTTDTALLLGAPAAMDFVAGANFGSGDLANSGHGWDPLG